jgi:hypothetical protein
VATTTVTMPHGTCRLQQGGRHGRSWQRSRQGVHRWANVDSATMLQQAASCKVTHCSSNQLVRNWVSVPHSPTQWRLQDTVFPPLQERLSMLSKLKFSKECCLY